MKITKMAALMTHHVRNGEYIYTISIIYPPSTKKKLNEFVFVAKS